MFLLACYERRGDAECLKMARHTLEQMYRGGLFDHIGFGFCRYSTDEKFLVPHFEKMLYDNAMMILAFVKAFSVTRKPLYLEIAERMATYVHLEMTSPEGGFYSAQDADSDGEEGKYYLLTPKEILQLLGSEDGKAFCTYFGITAAGNFKGRSIPNLLNSNPHDHAFDAHLERVRQYRRERCTLHLDDKILAAWNGLMIAALCKLYQASGNARYLEAAKRADGFIRESLSDGDILYVSYRKGKRGVSGFLDDYAACAFAQLALYSATLDTEYLERAKRLYEAVDSRFEDKAQGLRMAAVGIELDAVSHFPDLLHQFRKLPGHQRFTAGKGHPVQQSLALSEKRQQLCVIHDRLCVHVQKVRIVAERAAQNAAGQKNRAGCMSRIIEQRQFLQSMDVHRFIQLLFSHTPLRMCMFLIFPSEIPSLTEYACFSRSPQTASVSP